MASPRSEVDQIRVLLVGRTVAVTKAVDSCVAKFELTSVETSRAALDELDENRPHCVVTAHELEDSTGIELARSIRDECEEFPVILCVDGGDESVASEAVSAGVSDYLSVQSTPNLGEALCESIEQAVATYRKRASHRGRSRQFNAIFRDPHTYTWILDADGTITRANRAALDLIESDGQRVRGDPFWDSPWWRHSPETRTRVREATRNAVRGGSVRTEVTRSPHAAAAMTFDLAVRPVRDEDGAVVSLIAEATDITERVRLEEELRESEELHRVTLSNMTETVLITNEAGEFTYVCPNVHFIFGYTAEEIRELGTIRRLLGGDLFDRDELASEGVLTNIERTATDKADREHTLLVNVREVSIQDGTILYSCRDVTKRKQREEALTALHKTTRELLFAETKQEIGRVVVDDVTGALGLEASAILLFDTDENVLEPVARSREMKTLNGPLPSFRAGDESITGYAFVEGESLFFDDVHDSDLLANPATDIRSCGFVPLGDHGVLVVGSGEVGRFDDVARELADLLAATTEAALDRVDRDSILRKQDRELQEQNRQLSRLNQVNEIIREIDQALVQAETREEIEQAVCERLTKNDRFTFAWIGEIDPTKQVLQPRAWKGTDRGYLDSVSLSLDESSSEPSNETAASRNVTIVPNVAEDLHGDPWRKEAFSRDYQSAISVPLTYDEFMYGVLTVYADLPSAFDEMSRAVVAELGETVASAISSVERKNALLTTSITRLEYEVKDPNFALLRLARRADCALTVRGGVQQTSEGVYVFASVEGAALDEVAATAESLVSIEGVRTISEDDDGGTIRLRLSQPFIALNLAAHGAVLRSVSADSSRARIVIEVPSSVTVRTVVQIVSNAFSHAELLSKQQFDGATPRDLHSELLDQLTERQLEVMQAAYYGGFFELPRESTGEEIADALGISPPAFYRHNRTVQRKLFSTLFSDLGLRANSAIGG